MSARADRPWSMTTGSMTRADMLVAMRHMVADLGALLDELMSDLMIPEPRPDQEERRRAIATALAAEAAAKKQANS